MKTFYTVIAVAAVSLVAYGGYRIGVSRGIEQARDVAAASPAAQSPGGRQPLYWQDPMAPGQKFDKPGKSPYMDMPLVPVYGDQAATAGGVSVSPRMQQNLGVRTAEVTRGAVSQNLRVVGSVAYDERALALVTARANGYVERLYVRSPLEQVKKGQALAELYVPDWVAAQEEYLSVKRMQGAGSDNLLSGARQRMLLAGMSEAQVRAFESAGKQHPGFTLVAPLSGVVAELGAREGMTVAAGTVLYRINGLDAVWINAEIPEAQASAIVAGTRVAIRVAGLGDQVLQGRVIALLPEVNAGTRTLKARVEVANPRGELSPGMFANLEFAQGTPREVLSIPAEAVIETGARKLVMLAEPGGAFKAIEVETGAEIDGRVEVKKGLNAGDKVVLSGQFLIDSEASLKSATTRMLGPPLTPGTAPGAPPGAGK